MGDWYITAVQSDSETRVLQEVGRLVRDARRLLRLTQEELERRSGVSQSRISRIERGRCHSVRVVEVDRLFVALGVRYRLDATLPAGSFVVRDSVHVRCATYVQRRLEGDGWTVVREVEVRSDRAIGWIDILAFDPVAQILLVIEIKTELRDIGEVERSLNRYERGAVAVATSNGWRPTTVATALLLLATQANDQAIHAARRALDMAFPGRSASLRELVGGRSVSDRRSIAMIDPHSRRRRWVMPTILDGRRAPAPYLDYIDAVRRLEATRD